MTLHQKNMISVLETEMLEPVLMEVITIFISVRNFLFWGIEGLGNKSSLFVSFVRLNILCWTTHTQTKGTSRVTYMHIRF